MDRSVVVNSRLNWLTSEILFRSVSLLWIRLIYVETLSPATSLSSVTKMPVGMANTSTLSILQALQIRVMVSSTR